jgi:hypothetical protein
MTKAAKIEAFDPNSPGNANAGIMDCLHPRRKRYRSSCLSLGSDNKLQEAAPRTWS